MKRTLTIFTLAAICAAMMVSCKNTKTTEPTPEEIQVQKQALADSVLAQMDALYEAYNEKFQKVNAVKELAKYDEEISTIMQYFENARVLSSDEEMLKEYATIESAKQYFIANKDKYVSMRNTILQ